MLSHSQALSRKATHTKKASRRQIYVWSGNATLFEWEFIINGTVSPQLYTLSGRLLSLWYIPTSYDIYAYNQLLNRCMNMYIAKFKSATVGYISFKNSRLMSASSCLLATTRYALLHSRANTCWNMKLHMYNLIIAKSVWSAYISIPAWLR